MNDPKRPLLPPMFDGVSNGSVVWKRVSDIDHELLGYFLTCHLLIEHYMDEYLKVTFSRLRWDHSKLTFGQRVNLLKWEVLVNDQRFDPIPAIKHMNSLRNKISHRLEIRLDLPALQPLSDFLRNFGSAQSNSFNDSRDLLETFVAACCAIFASHLSFQHNQYPNS